jgi:predicted transcriptional regulator
MSSPSTPSQSAYQGELFDPPEIEAALVTRTPIAGGPSQSLSARRSHLVEALDEIAQANMRSGFLIAAESVQHPEIDVRYGRHTADVEAGAEFNRNQNVKKAKIEFAFAFGYHALKDSGIMPPTEADEMLNASFAEFANSYMGSGNRVSRDQYRKKLRRHS